MAREVDITPSPKMMIKIGATNLTLADAIAEIVANSFDAAQDGIPSVIEVEIAEDEISVIDNGAGMGEDILAEAVRLGNDMKDVTAKKSDTKGRFGLGMKTACASMGMWWDVFTRPVGDDREYRVSFDLQDWERRKNSPQAWKIGIEDRPKTDASPLGDRDHGTAVVVRKLRQKHPLNGPVLAKLGESFKAHLEQGDVIKVNGDAAKPRQYKFVPGSKVDIDLWFGPGDKLHITGWVALDTQLHNDGNYGFNIYRHNQLVMSWNKDWFPSHLMNSRIIGEVHMDFIDATFFKMGLQESEEWRLAKAEMTEFLKPVKKASGDLSSKGNVNNPVIAREIISNMRSGVGAEPIDGPMAPAPGGAELGAEDPPMPAAPPRELPKLRVDLGQLLLDDGTSVAITVIEKSLSSGAIPFDLIFDDFHEVPQLQAVINTAHPMWTQSNDKVQLRMLAVSDSILRYLIVRVGLGANLAAEARNEWILKAMKEGWK